MLEIFPLKQKVYFTLQLFFAQIYIFLNFREKKVWGHFLRMSYYLTRIERSKVNIDMHHHSLHFGHGGKIDYLREIVKTL